jgi:hypothetical protein
MFTNSVLKRRRLPAATWSSIWYLLSSFAVIKYTNDWTYVFFAAFGSFVGAYLTLTFNAARHPISPLARLPVPGKNDGLRRLPINICCGCNYCGPGAAAFQLSSRLCNWQNSLPFPWPSAPGEFDWRSANRPSQPIGERQRPGSR